MMKAMPKKNARPRTPASRAALLEGLVVEAVDSSPSTKNTGVISSAGEQRVDAVASPARRCRRTPSTRNAGCATCGTSSSPNATDSADADRGIEAAEQQPQHDRLEQQVKREHGDRSQVVIARLDRAIQYSAALVEDNVRWGYWMPRLTRGMTTDGEELQELLPRLLERRRSRRRSSAAPGTGSTCLPAAAELLDVLVDDAAELRLTMRGFAHSPSASNGSARRWSSSRSRAGSRRCPSGRGSWSR